MPNWAGSDRRLQLPANWRELRVKVATRAGWRCQNVIGGSRCSRVGSHCDHIRPGMDHGLENLQWLCPPCHNRKSGAEGAAGRVPLRRPAETHPGLRPAETPSALAPQFRSAGR